MRSEIIASQERLIDMSFWTDILLIRLPPPKKIPPFATISNKKAVRDVNGCCLWRLRMLPTSPRMLLRRLAICLWAGVSVIPERGPKQRALKGTTKYSGTVKLEWPRAYMAYCVLPSETDLRPLTSTSVGLYYDGNSLTATGRACAKGLNLSHH